MSAKDFDPTKITKVEVVARDEDGKVLMTMDIEVDATKGRVVAFDLETIFKRKEVDGLMAVNPDDMTYDWHLYGPMAEVVTTFP